MGTHDGWFVKTTPGMELAARLITSLHACCGCTCSVAAVTQLPQGSVRMGADLNILQTDLEIHEWQRPLLRARRGRAE